MPLRGVELHALEPEPLGVHPQLLEPLLAVARVEAVVVGQLARVGLGERERLLGLSEAAVVELAEVRRLEDRVVDVPVLEEVFHQPLAALVEVVLVGPDLRLRREVAVVVVEAVDELLAVDVPDVLRTGVPQRHVGVDDEVAFAVLAVHVRLRSE